MTKLMWVSFNYPFSIVLTITWNPGAISLSYPLPPPPLPIVIDDSSWKNAAESFNVALTLTLGGYESAIAPKC